MREHYSTHTIRGVGTCVTTYGREHDGSLYVKDVNGLECDALAPWLAEKLLKLEEANDMPREAGADEAYKAYQEERWHGQFASAR